MATTTPLTYSEAQKIKYATELLESIKESLCEIANQIQAVEALLSR